MPTLAVAAILLFFGSASAASVCCPDVGCFDTDGPFNHLPSPSCVKVFFALFNRDTGATTKITFNRNDKIPSAFDPKLRTVFLAHGYMNSHETSYMRYIKEALLKKEDCNVILTDWADGAGSAYYPNSASNTRVVGAEIAYVMDRLKKAGLSFTNLWCVGFSLGAHTCGHAGRATRIQRVTGLDPAGPWFHGQHIVAKLGPDCADFVDVIHTDGSGIAAYYGLLEPLGHIDFYPNGGYNQPGCTTYLSENGRPALNSSVSSMDLETYAESLKTMDLDIMNPRSMSCCHGRAVQFFAESILYDECFVARHICENENNLPRTCKFCNNGGHCVCMGYEADEEYTHPGKYYLETKSKHIFCRF